MQVRCPHCAAAFDTTRSGLQFCPNCGQQIQVPEGSSSGQAGSGGAPGAPPGSSGSGISPGPGGSPSASGAGFGAPPGSEFGSGGPGAPPPGPRQDTPWERRKQIGTFNALIETWKRTMFSPAEFWASVKPNGNWTDALLYAWLLFGIISVGKIPLQILTLDQSQRALDALGGMGKLPPEVLHTVQSLMSAAASPAALLGIAVFQVFFYPVGLFIFSGVVHLFCLLLGCAGNTFWATFRAIAYASAPNVLGVLGPLPFIGPLLTFVGSIWSIVMAIWGVYRLQDTTPGKAAASVLLMFVILCCCIGISIAIAGFGLASAIHGGR